MDKPRRTSNRAARAASLGLALVVSCLGALSIFAAHTNQTEVTRVQRSDALHQAYAEATTAYLERERAELEYIIDPSPDERANLDDANAAMALSLNEVAAIGDQADRELVDELLAVHAEYLIILDRFTAAVLAGDTAEATRIEYEEAEPLVRGIEDRIAAAALDRTKEADSSLAELHGTAQGMVILAPVLFAIGCALLLLFWRILEGHNRATRETYREIEQLSRLRSEFVSIVSHEFRTPLTGIQGFSELMRDEELTPAQTREYAGDINKDARRLARLITDMLDLDRMESGRMTLNSEPLDLNRIVTETAAQFRLSAADHPIALDLDGRLSSLLGDSDRLTQVVTNLVSNAIKYSPDGGPVELRTERGEKTVTLTVTDHGIGIPAEQLEKIFDRYSRVETTETRAIQGTGLGLPIVRQIVQLSDGMVWATSEPGQGSVFHVQLPLLEAVVRPALAA